MGASTDLFTHFTQRHHEREELLERVGGRIREIVAQAGPEGLDAPDVLEQAALDMRVSHDDAATAFWRLVDANQLRYSLRARVTVAPNGRQGRA